MDNEITLYGHPRSGNVYKVALMLALTGTPYRFQLVDLPGRETRGAQWRGRNGFGTLPMLTHGEVRVCQSNTILLYLAAHTGKFGAGGDPVLRLRISEWLFFEQDQVLTTIGRRRFLMKVAGGHPEVIAFLGAMSSETWLAGDSPTIADIAVYGYGRLAEEAGYDLAGRPAFRAWRERVEDLPGWGAPEDLMPT